MHRKYIFTVFCAFIIFLCIGGQSYGDDLSTADVAIDISMNKQEFSVNESIEVTVNITNNGTKNINRDGYCFTFILEIDDVPIELFCPYNASMGTIFPGESFIYNIRNLSEYSSNPETWEKIGNLPEGEYSLRAVYGSETNPWHDESDIPYNETISDVVRFKVSSNISNNGDNSSASWLLTYVLPSIAIIIILISIAYIWRRKRRSIE